MKAFLAGLMAGVLLLTATPTFAAEQSATQVAAVAAQPMSTEQRIADLESELKELKAMYTKDKSVQIKKEKDAADRIQFSGKAKLEQEWDSRGGKSLYSKKNRMRVDFTQSYKVDNTWRLSTTERVTNYFNNTNDNDSGTYCSVKMVGNLGNHQTLTIGRFNWEDISGYSIGDSWVNGVKYDFGKNWKTTAIIGRLQNTDWGKAYGSSTDAPLYRTLVTDGNVGAIKTAASATQVMLHGNTEYVYEGQVKFPIIHNVSGSVDLMKSTADEYFGTGSVGHTYRLQYKGMNKSKKGSFGIFTQYSNLPKAIDVYTGSPSMMDKNIWRVGADYVFEKNMWMRLTFDNGHKIANHESYQDVKGVLYFLF